jgi:hypothetical protein
VFTLGGPQVAMLPEALDLVHPIELCELDIATSTITLGGAVVRLLEARTERIRLYSHRSVRASDRHVIYKIHDASSMLLFPVVLAAAGGGVAVTAATAAAALLLLLF